jgi:DNA repair exonuclease SbcCD ATPase subunit
MKTLEIPTTNPIKSIIHISDIHLRTGDIERSRSIEYSAVFQNLIKAIKNIPHINSKEAIIIITGDFFHAKNKLEAPCLKNAVEFINTLSSVAPTIIIRGNHDYRQDIPHETDLITALMAYPFTNTHYINTTGHYIVNNIGIGVVAIQDTLLYGATSGITANLPDFPDPSKFPKSITNKIALFHGSITHARLQNGTSLTDTAHGYPIEWFNGYDEILLGDIHVQQVHRAASIASTLHSSTPLPPSLPNTTTHRTFYLEKGTWAYPGSLIQQDHGESICGHGFLLWNLDQKTVTEYHIHNTYGYITLQNYNDKWIIQHRTEGKSRWVELESIIYEEWFPINIYVRVGGRKTGATDLYEVEQILKNKNRNILRLATIEDTTLHATTDAQPMQSTHLDTATADTAIPDLNLLNSPSTWIQYMKEFTTNSELLSGGEWEEWVVNPQTLVLPLPSFASPSTSTTSSTIIPQQVLKKFKDRNEILLKKVEQLTTEQETTISTIAHRGNLKIHNMRWEWILNYGENNYFNFDIFDNKVTILNAKNGTGKSNFLEIIGISLFGEPFPSRTNKQNGQGYGIICQSIPPTRTGQTHISFSIGDTKYSLKREFYQTQSKKQLDSKSIVLYEENPAQNASIIIHQGKVATDEWIHKNLGSYDAFLMSSMLTQNSDKDFFAMDIKQQKDLLDRVLSLQSTQLFEQLLLDAKNTWKYANDALENCSPSASFSSSTSTSTSQPITEETLAHQKAEIDSLQNECNEMKQQISILYEKWCHVAEKEFMQTDQTKLDNDELLLKTKLQATSTTPTQQKQIIELLKKELLLLEETSPIQPSKSLTTCIDELNTLLEKESTMQINKPNISEEIVKMKYTDLKHTFDATHQKAENPISSYFVETKLHKLKELLQNCDTKIETQQSHITSLIEHVCEHNRDEMLSIIASYTSWEEGWMRLLHNQIPTSEYQTETENLKSTLLIYRTQLEEKTKLQNDILAKIKKHNEARPSQPKYTIKHHDAFDKKLQLFLKENDATTLSALYTEQLDNTSLIQTAIVEIPRYHEFISAAHHQKELLRTINTTLKKLKWAEDCKCCSINKTIIDKSSLTKDTETDLDERLTDAQQKLKELEEKANLDEWITLEKETNDFIKIVEDYQKEYTIYAEDKSNHTLNNEWKKIQYELEQQEISTQASIKFLEKKIIISESELNDRNRAIEYLRKYAEEKEEKQKQKNTAEEILSTFNKIDSATTSLQQLHKDRNAYTHAIQILEDWLQQNNELTILLSSIENVEKYNSWLEQVTTLKNNIKIHETIQQINLLKNKIEIEELTLSIMTKLEYISQIKTIYPVWIEWKQQQSSLKSLDERLYILHQSHSASQINYKREQEYNELVYKFEEYATEIRIGYDMLQQLSTIFQGYKSWLYKNKIAPILEESVNNILKFLTTERPLRLKAEWSQTLMAFQWFVQDGVHKPIIEKTSGFQKFIIGLSMRIALTQLGISKLKTSQLFIDEGFTSCDSENLEKIPEFLNNLINTTYKTIYIVSHLEELKSSINSQVKIIYNSITKISNLLVDIVQPPQQQSHPLQQQQQLQPETESTPTPPTTEEKPKRKPRSTKKKDATTMP